MKILLTGATGYIGRRLKVKLIEEGSSSLRLFVTRAIELRKGLPEDVEVVEGTTFDKEALRRALEGIDTAYYLIHSMKSGRGFEDLDRKSAQNFLETAIECGVKRIIYLGGLGTRETGSRHLRSRIETGEILSSRPGEIETLWFRAGIIIGSGSAGFEIIRNIVQKLPVMITPKWVNTRTEPVGIDTVLKYLVAAKDKKLTGNTVVDLGAEILTFREMILQASEVMGLKRCLFPVPFFTPGLSSYWLILFTPVPYRIAKPLVEGLKSETVKQNKNAELLFSHIQPVPFKEEFDLALHEIENNQVLSRWSDSTGDSGIYKESDFGIEDALYRFRVEKKIGNGSRNRIFDTVQSVGGKRGWFHYHFLWFIRGAIDKLMGGYGLNRGRRDHDKLRIGDSLDFWKVVDLIEGRKLLLYAEMKSPGKAWLEFHIQDNSLVQTAYFMPRGLSGIVYWYLLLPFHYIIFNNMAKQITRRSLKSGE